MPDPTTIPELLQARQDAAAAYLAAADTLAAAFVELSALDAVCANSNIGAMPEARTFVGPLSLVAHAEFQPGNARQHDWRAVDTRRDELIRRLHAHGVGV